MARERPLVAMIGAGSWGTAMANHLAMKGIPTSIWAREPEVVEGINTGHENPLFLQGVELDPHLVAHGGLHEAIDGAEVVVSAVPTQHVREVFGHLRDEPPAAALLVSLSKGIEVDSGLLPSAVLQDVMPGSLTEHTVALSGPSFAREVAARHPTAVVAASSDPDRARRVRDLFSSESFRVYSTDDVVSVELGGALKNVIAIAAGIADGLGFGNNTRAAIVTRGLAELARLGVALGGNPMTFAGLSGIGDLVLTCTGALSRNRSLGIEVGKGRTLEEIMASTREVAEGVKTAVAAHQLGARLGVDMPITTQVYRTLHEGKDPRQGVIDLMGRDLKDERSQEPTPNGTARS
jgi:glycerol-3-phosphate dehydrogenase (NAD(P)+)